MTIEEWKNVLWEELREEGKSSIDWMIARDALSVLPETEGKTFRANKQNTRPT